MRYFIDTEFIESGANKPIYLITLAIVAEDGRELYLQNADCPIGLANDWVKENVIPHIGNPPMLSQEGIQREVTRFIGDDEEIEFWGYFSDYDWVVLCQIFGAMMDLPEGWPMFCLDLKQSMFLQGIYKSELPKQILTQHNALSDARWIKEAYEFVQSSWSE